MSLLHELRKIKEMLNSLISNVKDENLGIYDHNIDYDHKPTLYKRCPHCNAKEHDYEFIKEVLEDAIMKVKCNQCGNNFYIDFGK
ncbi:MAG: hypothetical protein ACFFCI_01060 [Promethearchaeota archaeon]